MKVVVRYKKLGLIRFLSPLETSKAIERNVRRADIAIEFSRGFHPMPKLSYLDSTATGVVNRALYVQMEVVDWSEDDFERLASTSLKGLEPVEWYRTNYDMNDLVNGYRFRIIVQKGILKSTPNYGSAVFKGKRRKRYALGDLVEDLIVRSLKDFLLVEYTLKRENFFSPWGLLEGLVEREGLVLPILEEALVDDEPLSSFLEREG